MTVQFWNYAILNRNGLFLENRFTALAIELQDSVPYGHHYKREFNHHSIFRRR